MPRRTGVHYAKVTVNNRQRLELELDPRKKFCLTIKAIYRGSKGEGFLLVPMKASSARAMCRWILKHLPEEA